MNPTTEIAKMEVLPPAPQDDSRTLRLRSGQALSDFAAGQLSEHTRQAYRRDLEEFFGQPLSAVRPEDVVSVRAAEVIAFRDRLIGQGLRPATIARKLSTVRSLFAYLKERGVIRDNPCAGRLTAGPRVNRESPTPWLTGEELDRLFGAIDRSILGGKRDYALLLCFFKTGLRRGEIAAAKVSDIVDRGDGPELRVLGKGGKEEYQPLSPDLMAALDDYLAARGNDGSPYLFRGHARNRFNGAGLNTASILYLLRRCAKRAGIEKPITPHSLRHTAISQVLEAGGSLEEARVFARHSDIRTTQNYLHTERDLKRQTLARLGTPG